MLIIPFIDIIDQILFWTGAPKIKKIVDLIIFLYKDATHQTSILWF